MPAAVCATRPAADLVPRGLAQLLDQRRRVEADRLGEIEKFDQIDPALATLDLADERLMPAETGNGLASNDPDQPDPVAMAGLIGDVWIAIVLGLFAIATLI